MRFSKEEAFNIIVQALEGAVTGQKFGLKDSATIYSALQVVGEAVLDGPVEMKKGKDIPEPELREDKPETEKSKK